MLTDSVKYLAGVGEKRAEMLTKELGIKTLDDFLYYFPFRYIDRSRFSMLSEISEEEAGYMQFKLKIEGFQMLGDGFKRRFVAIVRDQHGEHGELVWFKGITWIQKRLKIGDTYIVFGRPSIFNGTANIVHPELESVLTDNTKKLRVGVQGVYSTTERLNNIGLGTRAIYNLMCTLWPIAEPMIKETLPEYIIKEVGLISLKDALFNIHFPTNEKMLQQAELRLKFEELFGLQLQILSQRNQIRDTNSGHIFNQLGEKFNRFYNERLAFPLTGAQKRVVREMRADMVTGRQMNRLLQGDVGSGKTVVAVIMSLIAIDNGFQSSIMAPTEILARQHYESVCEMLGDIGVRVALLTGSTRKKERDRILTELAEGEIDLLIGTHALIEERVQFQNLGFVTIDEQHRFGVDQRARLWKKGADVLPHILVMTATPIPRTLAMTIYGDLSISVIDELPPGRKPIRTLHYYDSARMKLFGFMREQIAKGRQIYIVYPMIKESEKFDYKYLEDGVESIMRAFPPPEYVSVVVHGKMKSSEKEYGMRLFKEGKAQILIATTVIEVGVNVPNASIMVIESAERFGLSQLHQLRGRVGRGAEQSYCILMTAYNLKNATEKRINAMVETNDGFVLAELDLRLRGAGDISGTQQSGLAFDLRIANIAKDTQIVQLAHDVAERVLTDDKTLTADKNRELKVLMNKYKEKTLVDYSLIS